MLDMTSRRTVSQTIRIGLSQALRNARLVLLVWFAFLTLACIAALPAWRWWDGVLSLAPEGDRLLSGLNIALLRELSHYDRSPTVAIALGSTFTFFLIALILNPFIAGGTLAAIPPPRESGERVGVRGLTPQFVDDGVRWYWRFARILLLVGLLGAGIAMVLMTGFEAVGLSLHERGLPRASMWVDNLMLLAVAIVFGVSSLVVDVARICMRRRDDGRAAAAVREALGFIVDNIGAVLAIGLAFLALLGTAVVIYNAIASGITPRSWGLIAFTIAWQQLFALARTALRVGLLGSLVALVDARTPRPVAPPVDDVPAGVTLAGHPGYP